MKSMGKIILAGLAAFGAACSNDASVEPDVSGATTEPSTSPTAQLTEEQKAVLEKSFYSLLDTIIAVPDNVDDMGIELDPKTVAQYKLMYPFFGIIPDTTFAYPSLDGRRKCNVSTFSAELGMEFSQSLDTGNVYYSDTYNKKHYSSTIAIKVLDVDGDSVVMETVGSTTYWGYDASCSEFLTRFKQSCTASNGIFKDFEDGCRNLNLSLACSMIIPEGKTPGEVIDSLTGEYKNACREDSLKYAAVDDDKNAPKGCSGGGSVGENGEVAYYSDCPLPEDNFNAELDSLNRIWRTNLSRTFDAYQKQFAVYEDVVDGMVYLRHYPELVFGDGSAYNTFPDAAEARPYKNEGIYRLPDSLVSVFFPEAARCPYVFDAPQRHSQIYYIIVLKDVGAKGHILNKVDVSGIYVRDILKSGENCPEDTTEHYSVYLIRGAAEWDVSDKQIIRETYVSTLWNCDDPESLERIEPYGEWTSRDGFI